MRRFVTIGPALVLLLATCVVLLGAPAVIRQINTAQIAARIAEAQYTLEDGNTLDRISAERAAVHDAVMPGVVHIVTVDDSMTREQQRFSFGLGASGAGWLWDDRGHIITNAHVVEGDGRIRVELFDGRVREGRRIASDPYTDIAVIKIDNTDGLFPLNRATGNRVRTGEVAFAFGSPFGIKFSMSQGTISGLNRSKGAGFMRLRTGYTNFIQTDAAMNPGNSGGPLVDANGEVIGMCSAIANARRTPEELDANFGGQSAGIGFAIPLDTVETVVRQFLERQRPIVVRGYLGVALNEIDPVAARNAGFDGLGVVVMGLFPDTPASEGGLERGDIIVSVAGTDTPDLSVLQSEISIQQPGTPVEIVVWRDGERLPLQVSLGAATIDAAGNLIYLRGSEEMSPDEIDRALR